MMHPSLFAPGPEAEIEAPISHVNDLPDVMTGTCHISF